MNRLEYPLDGALCSDGNEFFRIVIQHTWIVAPAKGEGDGSQAWVK